MGTSTRSYDTPRHVHTSNMHLTFTPADSIFTEISPSARRGGLNITTTTSAFLVLVRLVKKRFTTGWPPMYLHTSVPSVLRRHTSLRCSGSVLGGVNTPLIPPSSPGHRQYGRTQCVICFRYICRRLVSGIQCVVVVRIICSLSLDLTR